MPDLCRIKRGHEGEIRSRFHQETASKVANTQRISLKKYKNNLFMSLHAKVAFLRHRVAQGAISVKEIDMLLLKFVDDMSHEIFGDKVQVDEDDGS